MNIDVIRDKVNEMVTLIEEKKEINNTMYNTLCAIVNDTQGSECCIILYDGYYDIGENNFAIPNSFTGDRESVIAVRFCDGYLQIVTEGQFHRFPRYADEIDEDLWTTIRQDDFNVEDAFDVILPKIVL
jgi:hypothetical protein